MKLGSYIGTRNSINEEDTSYPNHICTVNSPNLGHDFIFGKDFNLGQDFNQWIICIKPNHTLSIQKKGQESYIGTWF